MKNIHRILSIAMLVLLLSVSMVQLSYGHNITLTLNSGPINGVNVWYETTLGAVSGGPLLTDTAVVVPSSDQGAFPFGEGAYKISYELQPTIGGTEYILSHFIINGTEEVGYKQDVVYCVLGEVSVGYLRESLFGDTTIEAIYLVKTFGPKIDLVRFNVIRSPDPTLIGMQTCTIDTTTDLIRTGDIEKLATDGFTITSAAGFHMGHIGINIRPDQSYKTVGSKIAGPVLSDVNFRHALLHCYNQEEIVASIYKYIVTPVRSLVPPAQGGWVNPDIEKHPYNPGVKTGTTVYNPATGDNEDSCSILRYGGYTYDAVKDNWKTPYDLDGDTVLNDYIPQLRVFTPTYEVAPTSAEHGARFCADNNKIGIPLLHDPREFSPYLDLVFGTTGAPGGNFDLYMVFWGLGRFPDHLYDMCISTQDTYTNPGAYNSPGLHSDELDEAVSTIKFSLDHEAKMEAAYKAQMMFYNETYADVAFSYLQLYSRILFNAFKPGLKGIVNSPGFGSDNSWTFLNMHWESGHPNERIEGGDSVIVWHLGEIPERLNPCYASTVYAWEILGTVLDGLMQINPYTHEDLPWHAWDWEIEKWATEEDVDKLLLNLVPVLNESIGYGDGETTVFNLENCHVVPGSETVYLNLTLKQTKVTDYTIDYTAGEITFTTAPSDATWISVYYTYQYLIGSLCHGSHWHEDWPVWSRNWYMTEWNGAGILTIGDQVGFEGDDNDYIVKDMTWDIKVERKECPYDEMKLSGTDVLLPRPPIPFDTTVVSPVGKNWHEEWPVRSTNWLCQGFTDNGDGILSRSDQIMFGGYWWHVDSVTVTLHLDKTPIDTEIDKVMEFAGTGMKVLYWLREDLYWQDGNQFTAEDVVFNWLFMRNNRIPRYTSTWQNIVDAVTVGLDGVSHFKVVAYLNVTSQFLVYDLAGMAALLPPPVWRHLDGRPLIEILSYDPTANVTKPTGAGPRFGTSDCPTQLYGTGPFVFDFYDPVGMYGEVHANRYYFMATTKIQAEKAEMFHKIGDADWDGEIGIFDLSRQGRSYGYFGFEPTYDAQADVNQDHVVDMRDITMTAFFWGDKREYPEP